MPRDDPEGRKRYEENSVETKITPGLFDAGRGDPGLDHQRVRCPLHLPAGKSQGIKTG